MQTGSANIHAAPQSHAAAHNGSRNGIAFKSPVQQKGMGGEEEQAQEPISSYMSGNGQEVPPFKPATASSPVQKKDNDTTTPISASNLKTDKGRLRLQLKEQGGYLDAATSPAFQQTAQLAKLTNGDDTDNYSLEELEKMVNNLEGFGLDEEDAQTIYEAMDDLKGGAPAAMDYQGADDDADDDDYSDHEFFNFDTIPKSKHQEHTVNGKYYRFWNDAYRCVEFTDPKDKNVMGTITKATAVKIEERVNIKGAGGKIKGIPTEDLKQPKKKNYYHFKAANIEAGLGSAGTSPDGKTWHHHANEGQMELLDRDVHAAFKHAGGKKYWGSV